MCSFNYLPIEILLKIFDNLNFEDRKNVSEVCQLWNALAYSTKFMKKVNLKLKTLGKTELDEIQKWLEQSDRDYLSIEFHDIRIEPLNFNIMRQILHKSSHSLSSLQFSYCWNLKWLEILEVLDIAPNLKEIGIFGYIYYGNEPLKLPTFTELKHLKLGITERQIYEDIKTLAPNLTHLSLNNYYAPTPDPGLVNLIEYYNGQLKYLSVDVPDCKTFRNICKTNVECLEELHLGCDFEINSVIMSVCNFFRQFRQNRRLKKLSLRMDVSDEILSTICDNCLSLEHLIVCGDHSKVQLKEQSAHKLENLKSLSVLEIKDMKILTSNANSIFDQIFLPKLEKLVMYRTNVTVKASDFKQLAKCAPILKIICIDYVIFTDDCVHEISNSFSNLENLEIYANGNIKDEALIHLNKMKKLRSLKLDFIDVTKHAFDVWPVMDLRSLDLTFYDMKDSCLLGIVKKVPLLKELTISNNHQITIDGINQFKKQMPECVVRCQNCTRLF